MIGLKWENYQPTILNIVKLSYHNELKEGQIKLREFISKKPTF